MRLQGHLSEYPLRDLFTIFTDKRETGRLQIDFESAPGIFHFKDGKLIAARIGPIQGFSAVNLAFSLADASFQFDTDTTAPHATINDPNQLLLTRLLGINVNDLEHADDTEFTPLPVMAASDSTFVAGENTSEAPAPIERGRGLQIAEVTLNYIHGHMLAATAAAILLLIVPAVIAITVRLGNVGDRTGTDMIAPSSNRVSGSPSDSVQLRTTSSDKSLSPAAGVDPLETTAAVKAKSMGAKPKVVSHSTALAEGTSDPELTETKDKPSPGNSTRMIAVVMQIEDGHVSGAYIKDHHPGLEAFEATAIRLARQRRFAKDKAGTETIVIKVTSEP